MIKLKTSFRQWIFVASAIAYASLIIVSCNQDNETNPFRMAEEGEEFSGGEATVFDISVNAFGNPAPNLEGDGDLVFITGNSFFNRNWVTAPASTEDLDGLGPHFNSRSCSGCHFKDGRGNPPSVFGEDPVSLLFRLSKPGITESNAPIPEENYGLQLSTQSVLGIKKEGNVQISYQEIVKSYPDGTPYTLLKPIYKFTELGYGPMNAGTLVSPRVAPHMIGLGLLEAIDEIEILSRSDPDDVDNDGISGRANYVWDAATEQATIGRFGWKANQPNLEQQTAGAFLGDIGLTTSVFPNENCSDSQDDCKNQINGGDPEVRESIFQKVVFYSSTLAVPKRRDWDQPEILRGKQLFHQANCISCHTPKITTGTNGNIPEFFNQVIRPYTDLLLHDMGDDLADGRPDFLANGNEWRTPPLWGIGLIETVNGHTNFLHDGRARNMEEAILWHGGEAASSKNNFLNLPKEDRMAMIKFLNSL